MDNKIVNVLTHLTYFDRGLSRRRLEEDTIRECKTMRKKLSKEEAENRGYNIFEKKKPCIKDLVDYCYDRKFIKLKCNDSVECEDFQLTVKGEIYLQNAYTNKFCPEYKEFEIEVNRLMKEYNKPLLEEMQIMKLFRSGYTAEKAVSYYKEWNKYNLKTRQYQEYILKKSGHNLNTFDNKYIFHLYPKLFVPYELMNSKVTLKVEGVDVPENLTVLKPVPNKRYYIAGLSFGKEKSAIGFYPVVKSKEEFPKKLEIKLIWNINDTYTIEHVLKLKFRLSDEPGNLFSTYQHFSGCCRLNRFGIVTYFKDETAFSYDNRDLIYKVSNDGRYTEITERAILNNFPMEMANAFSGNKYFDKFLGSYE